MQKINKKIWITVGKRGNAGDALLYEVFVAQFKGLLDLDYRGVQTPPYLQPTDDIEDLKDIIIGPGAYLSGTFSSKKFQLGITEQWGKFKHSRFHLWTTGMVAEPLPEEINDVLRITNRAQQIYVRGNKEAELLHKVDPDLLIKWVPYPSCSPRNY